MRRRRFLAAMGPALASAAPGAGTAQAQTRWVMATPYAENFHTLNIRAFIQDVEQATGGRLSVQLHNNASLLPMAQIKRGVQTGQVQLGEILLSAYANEDPFFEVDGVPFLAWTWPQAEALQAATEPYIRARLERQGLVPLYMVHWDAQGFYTRGELRSVQELRGTRFRAYNNVTARMAELMGATPVTVQAAEVSQAFATNVIQSMFTSAQTGVSVSAWDYGHLSPTPSAPAEFPPPPRTRPALGATRAPPSRGSPPRRRRGRAGSRRVNRRRIGVHPQFWCSRGVAAQPGARTEWPCRVARIA
jgi:TRAP-type transport system periplasmic protein